MKKEEKKVFPFGEAHLHIFMNGTDYQKAVRLQKDHVNDQVIRDHFMEYQKAGITWLRDGGDPYGTSKRAAQLAEEYGLTYRTPIYGIHKNGCYGKIVGRGFDNMEEYTALVREVRKQGGNYIKIMISGIMDFNRGGLTEEPLTGNEIQEMIHIAHEEGFPVMVHVNGADAVRAAALAGADSIEHGNFCDEDALQAMAASSAVWVPTIVTVKNLIGNGRFPDQIVKEIWEGQKKNLNRGMKLGIKMALGSDAGAYCVLHGKGVKDEYQAFKEALEDRWPDWEKHVLRGDQILKKIF